jgi:uncharacterized lipoprotein YajG
MELFVKNLVIIGVLGVLASGCAFSTANVDLAYKRDPATKSPLATVKPVKIALLVEDQRPITERETVGNKKNGLGMVTASVKPKSDVLGVISDALKTELSANGHKVQMSNEPSDVTLRVQLKRYWTDVSIHFFDLEMTGIITADFTFAAKNADKPLLTQAGQGSYRESRQIATEGAYESALNGALNEFVRNFSRDPNIIKALQQAGQSPAPM